MSASIRGHLGQFKIYQDGAVTSIVNLTNVTVNQDSTFIRTNYVGQPVPEGDQAFEGWSGSCEAEVKDASIDQFIDGLVTNNLNGIGISNYTFVITELYSDGTQSSYVYSDVQWKMGRKQGGLQEKITKHLDFQASFRQPVKG